MPFWSFWPLQIRANLPPGVDGWGLSLRGLMSMVVLGGFIISAVFWWLNRTVSLGDAAVCGSGVEAGGRGGTSPGRPRAFFPWALD